MIDQTFDIDKEYDNFHTAMSKLNSEPVLEHHRIAMRLAFVCGIMRVMHHVEKFENQSWEHTEEIKKMAQKQAGGHIIDLEIEGHIKEVMAEINAEGYKSNEAFTWAKAVCLLAIGMMLIAGIHFKSYVLIGVAGWLVLVYRVIENKKKFIGQNR